MSLAELHLRFRCYRTPDFGEVVHKDGLSPAWPLPYDVFEPFYTEAEKLFHVHGQRGEDPGEPTASGRYPFSRSRTNLPSSFCRTG